jgi:hypothetical protein
MTTYYKSQLYIISHFTTIVLGNMTHMNHNKLLFKYLFYYYLLCIQKDIYTLKFFQEKK